jgi:hypothetical protein
VFSKPGKFNDGIACTPHIDQSVKASSRFRIQSSSCAARSVDVNSVPKAGSFDDVKSNNQASAYVPQIENRGIGLLPEEGNGTASDHLGEDVSFPIESSFSDNVEGSESIELQEGSSLIPTELLKKNQTVELPKQEIEQSSNNTEQLPERNRARNIRSSDNPKQD